MQFIGALIVLLSLFTLFYGGYLFIKPFVRKKLALSKRRMFKKGWVTLLTSFALFILGGAFLQIGSGSITIVEGMGTMIMFIFFFTLIYGLYLFMKTLIRRIRGKEHYSSKKHFGIATGVIVGSFILAGFGAELSGPAPTETENTVAEVNEGKDTAAEERTQEENKEKQEKLALQKRKEEVHKLEEEIETILSKAEEEPTRENYEDALELVNFLPSGEDRYSEQLDNIKETVVEEEDKLASAEELIAQAEEDQTEENLEKASRKVASLMYPNEELEKRLSEVENDLEKKQRAIAEREEREEEQKRQEEIASQREKEEEAEKERKEQEQKRLAEKEQEEQRKEEQERVEAAEAERSRLAEQENAQQQETQMASVPQETEVQESTEVASAVWIAPDSGEKYHHDPNCRGLSQANSIVEMSLSDAQNNGYTLCGWED